MDKSMIDHFLVQAQVTAFEESLTFAMSQPDFDLTECNQYMALAFQKNNAHAYRQCIDFIYSHIIPSQDQCRSSAYAAYFSLKPSILAVVIEKNPTLLLEKVEGDFDLLRSGIFMALTSFDSQSAIALAQAALHVGFTETHLSSLFDDALTSIKNVKNMNTYLIDDDFFETFETQCHFSHLTALTPEAQKTSTKTLSL